MQGPVIRLDWGWGVCLFWLSVAASSAIVVGKGRIYITDPSEKGCFQFFASLQVPVDESPQLWWQHAGRAVLTERAQVLLLGFALESDKVMQCKLCRMPLHRATLS